MLLIFIGRCIIGFLLSTRGRWYILQGCRDWCWFGGRNGWEQVGWREALERPVAKWNCSKLGSPVELRRALSSKKYITLCASKCFLIDVPFLSPENLEWIIHYQHYQLHTTTVSSYSSPVVFLTYQRQRLSPGGSTSCNNVWLRWNRYVWSVGRKVWTKRRCLGRCFGCVVIVVMFFWWKRKENSARVIIWYVRNF